MSNLLPSTYKELEYIESTGTQYIDTGINGTNKTAVWTTTVENLSSATNTALISSGYAQSVRNCYGTFIISNTWSTLNTGSVTATGKQNIVSTTIINTSDTTSTTIVVDGVQSSTSSRNYDTSHNMNNTTLFASKANGSTMTSGGNFKLYSASCSLDDVLARNFIPAERVSDNVVGMYDTVSSTFFTNAGTGDFIAGPYVQKEYNCYKRMISYGGSRLPSGYTEVEYIQSSGTQYIDTGIYSKNITSAEVKFNLSNTNNFTGFGDTSVGTGSGYPASMWCERSAIKWYYSGGSAITLGSHDTDITATLPFPIQTAGLTVHIFHATGATTDKCATGKYYYTRLLNGTNIVFNGIPAKNSSNVIGMYDTVSGTFFTNAGTGTFTAGSAVSGIVTSNCYLSKIMAGGSRLPSGYTELEYIESSGTQYIDTGYVRTLNDDIECEFTDYSAGVVFGNIAIDPQTVLLKASTSVFAKNFSSGGAAQLSVSPTGTYKVLFKSNGEIYVNDTLVTTQAVVGANNENIYLFGYKNASSVFVTTGVVKLNKVRIGSSRNLIPAKNSSNVVGMYDLVTNQFFTNQGSGTFTPGPEAQTIVTYNIYKRVVNAE